MFGRVGSGEHVEAEDAKGGDHPCITPGAAAEAAETKMRESVGSTGNAAVDWTIFVYPLSS